MTKALKAVGMYAIGLPMNRIGQRLHIKGQTVKKTILLLAREEHWDTVRKLITRNFRLYKSELEEVSELPLELDFQWDLFRGRAFDFLRQSPHERRNVVRRARRIAEKKILV